MKILIWGLFLISSVFSKEILLPSQSPVQLSLSQIYNGRPLKSRIFNENCGNFSTNINVRTFKNVVRFFLESASGMLVDITVENCTDVTACNIITKREYNVQVDFISSKYISICVFLVWNIKIKKN